MDSAGNDVVAFHLTDPARNAQPRFYNQILSPSEIQLFRSGAVPTLSLPARSVPTLSVTAVSSPTPSIPAAAGQFDSFHIYLWMCWSIKESAYKFLKRHNPNLRFSPTSLEVSITDGKWNNNVLRGQIDHLFWNTVISHKGIRTTVHNSEDFTGVCTGFDSLPADKEPTPENQSAQVREYFLRSMTEIDAHANWTLGKHPDGYPLVYKDGILQPIPLSFAHHGELLGYSYFLPGS
jgi:hypothetical protein